MNPRYIDYHIQAGHEPRCGGGGGDHRQWEREEYERCNNGVGFILIRVTPYDFNTDDVRNFHFRSVAGGRGRRVLIHT